jgi:WD40 repeat protein
VIPASPYKGLTAFDDSELDALLFFGRERETEIVVANLIASRLTVLYGPSGVGKSSLLSAAVARELRALPEQPLVVVFSRWADDPAAALSQAVGGENGSLLDSLEEAQRDRDVYLILDQADEYFLYHADDRGPGSVAESLPAVLNGSRRINVLVSLREDALAKLDRFTGRIPGLFANTLRLDRLDRSAARAAIVKPVERFNELAGTTFEVEDALVDQVLDEVGVGRIEPALGGLGGVDPDGTQVEAPYLQLVMQRLWDEERAMGSDVLHAGMLTRLGGAQRIVAEHLDRAVAALTVDQKDLAARTFNHLVTPSGTKVAHRLDDLAGFGGVPKAEVKTVLDVLAEHRIVRSFEEGGEFRYEIFHDVLAQPVLGWRAQHRTERLLERERAEARRRHRRLGALAVGALVALAGMTAVALYALDQRAEAREQTKAAQARELVARAASSLDSDPQAALRLAAAAGKLESEQRVEPVLRSALLETRTRAVVTTGGSAVAASPAGGGRRIFAAGSDGALRLVDLESGADRYTVRHPGQLVGASLAAGGRILSWGDGAVRVWRPPAVEPETVLRHPRPVRWAELAPSGRFAATASGRVVRGWTLQGRVRWAARLPTPAVRLTFSPDGRLLAVIGNDRQTRLVDVRDGRVVRLLDQGGRTTAVDFSPTQPLLATGGTNSVVRLWTQGGRLVRELTGHEGTVLDVSFGPGGRLLASGSSDGTVRVWSLRSGELVSRLAHSNHVTSVAFSPDGSTLATASRDRTSRIWNIEDGVAVAVLAGHRDSVRSVAFTPDGTRVITGSDDGTVRVWDREAQPKLSLVARFAGPVLDASPGADGRILVVGPGRLVRILSGDGSVLETLRRPAPVDAAALSGDARLLVVAAGRTLTLVPRGSRAQEVRQPARIASVAVSPDGTLVATAGRDGRVRVVNADGRSLQQLRAPTPLTDVAFDPAGFRAAASGADGRSFVWNLDDGRLETTLVGHRKAAMSIAWSPNGEQLVTASLDQDARVWDSRTGDPLRVLRFHFAVVSEASFSPDGRWIVTAGPVTAQLWRAGSARPLYPFGLGGHTARLTSAEWLPSGRSLVTASVDGTVRQFQCKLCGGVTELIDLADDRLAALQPR